jgi:nucleotide-binding universal stress UspA family protein
MRVLIATDGSPCSDAAVNLAGSVRWPDLTTLRVVTVVELARMVATDPWMALAGADPMELEQTMAVEAQVVLDRADRQLRGGGWALQTATIQGRPASALVDEARDWGADLIIVGSRGHGRIATMVLGSVSAEVVDHAPCPVLVARHPAVRRAMLAEDGSAQAAAARRLVLTLPMFRDMPVDVVSVGHDAATVDQLQTMRVPAGARPTGLDAGIATQLEHVELERSAFETLAEQSATELRLAGIAAEATGCVGDPAESIVALAEGRGVDLIVMGTHGRTGLDRIRLGSVARNVLLHSHASVLVTRGGTPSAEA